MILGIDVLHLLVSYQSILLLPTCIKIQVVVQPKIFFQPIVNCVKNQFAIVVFCLARCFAFLVQNEKQKEWDQIAKDNRNTVDHQYQGESAAKATIALFCSFIDILAFLGALLL